MTMNPRWMGMLLLAGIGAWSGAALAEDLVVIETSDPKVLAEGAMVADGKAIELPAGARVVLVGGSGKTVQLAGPYKGVPSAGTDKGDSRIVVALASLVTRRPDETTSVGAIRAVNWRKDFVKSVSDVMMVDVDQRGTQCVLESNAKQIALIMDPSKKVADKFGMVSAEAGTAETLTWPAISAPYPKLGWPASLPIEDGNTYLIEMPQRTSINQFTVKVLTKPAANNVDRMAQLAEAGCDAQARLMVEVLKKAAQ
jgi:hypothetical protein